MSPSDRLPIHDVLPRLLAELDRHGTAVLTAPPGTGKTTVVPLALAEAGLRVLVAEPRRLAVRAAAKRMGVSYTIRGERRVGANPMVEVVTTGVLLQRLQRDQELAGVDVVLLDECHERHLDADTALAFLLDVRDTLRPDLRVLATSATADALPWARLLGTTAPSEPPVSETGEAGAPAALAPLSETGEARLPASETRVAPIVRATGATHPVEVVWAPPARPVAPPHGLRVDPALLSHVAQVVRRALAERQGDVLCFLPGVGEIARVAGMLGDVEVLQVHGQAPARVQDAVLSPGSARRVVLATSVAESSLTVPGVRVVVDSGLAREPRTDHARGLGSLTTVRVSKSSATQRAGRAGREAPGTVYRCWPEAEHERLADHARPEIALADLTGFALQAACWGVPDAEGLALLDPPPPAALAAATRTLHALGALEHTSSGGARVTGRGRRMARAGVHPRLARALIDAGPRAAEVVALLSEPLPREAGDDLAEIWRAARRGGDAFAARWRQEVTRLRRTATDPDARTTSPGAPPAASTGGSVRTKSPGTATAASTGGSVRTKAAAEATGKAGAEAVPSGSAGSAGRAGGTGGTAGGTGEPAGGTGGAAGERLGDDALAGLVVALAFPERVARRRGGGYLMASGTEAQLAQGSRLASARWLAVAVADRPTGSASARVRQAVEIDEETARQVVPVTVEEEVAWRVPPGERRGDVSARVVERLGAIELSSAPLKDADVREAVLTGLRTEDVLTWTKEALAVRDRLAFCHRALGDPWLPTDSLADLADRWLEPELSRARRRADLERIDVASALRRLVPWSERLEEVAPERVEVPTGSRIRVDYSGEQPVLAVKLQELFGWDEAPRIAGVPLLIHLLSPAGRPVAVTADLASFWREGYRSVRAELRGRYPKHPWPEDPLTAVPTRRVKRAPR